MEKQIRATEARRKFHQIVDEVQHNHISYIINRHDKPAAAVVPLHVYESWKRRHKRLANLIHEVQTANAAADPQEVLQDVLEAQQAVRSLRK